MEGAHRIDSDNIFVTFICVSLNFLILYKSSKQKPHHWVSCALILFRGRSLRGGLLVYLCYLKNRSIWLPNVWFSKGQLLGILKKSIMQQGRNIIEWFGKKKNTRRGKHNVQYIWCKLFPEDCLSLIVHLQPEYSDAGQPASACYCSAVWASSLVKKETETDFSLPSITVPHAPLCCLRTPSCSPHQDALVHADLCRCRTHGFAWGAFTVH